MRFKTTKKGWVSISNISEFTPKYKYQVELFLAKKTNPVVKRAKTKVEANKIATMFSKRL